MSEEFTNIETHITWIKGEKIPVGKYFHSNEFMCRCNFLACQEQRISKDLVGRLDRIRERLGRPLQITSAYRCSEYQQVLRKNGVSTVVAKKSTHEDGEAADARPLDKNMEGFLQICETEFESIGIANTFLHLDTRAGKRRWNY
jgi:zinc D-Ala-D-Ala carboxypeptidase